MPGNKHELAWCHKILGPCSFRADGDFPPFPSPISPSQVPREWRQRADMLRSLDVQHDTPHAWRQAPDERYAWNHHGSEVAHLKQRLVRR